VLLGVIIELGCALVLSEDTEPDATSTHAVASDTEPDSASINAVSPALNSFPWGRPLRSRGCCALRLLPEQSCE